MHTQTHEHMYTHQSHTELYNKLTECTVNTVTSNFYVTESIIQTKCKGVA
jgi:hypothetical protein